MDYSGDKEAGGEKVNPRNSLLGELTKAREKKW